MHIGMRKGEGIDFTKELDFASDASKVVEIHADGIRDGAHAAGSDHTYQHHSKTKSSYVCWFSSC